jgi:hypothetical protein
MGMEMEDDKDGHGFVPSTPFTTESTHPRSLPRAEPRPLEHDVLNGLGGSISAESLERLKDAVDLRWLNMSWCHEFRDEGRCGERDKVVRGEGVTPSGGGGVSGYVISPSVQYLMLTNFLDRLTMMVL